MSPDRGEDSMVPSGNADNQQSGDADATSASPPPSVEAADVPAHLSHDRATNGKQTEPFQFGQRLLSSDDDVFAFNAWDHVAPDESHKAYAESQYSLQQSTPVSDFDRHRFNDQPEKWWDLFYKQKQSTFFKDRKWLMQEFPVLQEVTRKGAGPKVVLEVGAGAGNTAFPIVRVNENEELQVVAVDFSRKAVETMRAAPDYDDGQGIMRAEVWDAAGEELPDGVVEGSVDVLIMIFIFSALSPREWTPAVRNVHRLLKPGGQVLFRDYGRGDLAQVRFKAGRWMEENFYVRGDGTRVYFFEREELEAIWGAHRGSEGQHRSPEDQDGLGQEEPKFDILDLDVDRRLIVNRQRRIKMYRCWIQGRFQKAGPAGPLAVT